MKNMKVRKCDVSFRKNNCVIIVFVWFSIWDIYILCTRLLSLQIRRRKSWLITVNRNYYFRFKNRIVITGNNNKTILRLIASKPHRCDVVIFTSRYSATIGQEWKWVYLPKIKPGHVEISVKLTPTIIL